MMKNIWKFSWTTALLSLLAFSASAYELPSSCTKEPAIALSSDAPEKLIRMQLCQALKAGQTRDLYLGENKEANPVYLNVLQYFSIDTFAMMARGRQKLSDVPSLEYALKASEEIRARRAQIDLTKISSVDEFLKAAGVLLGSAVNFRHFDVVMSSNLASDNPQILTIDPATYEMLQKNQFLLTYNKRTSKDGSQVRTGISYTYIGAIQKMLRQKTLVLDEKSTETILSMDANAGDYKLEKEKKAYQTALRALISKLFAGDESLTPFEMYQRYMAIHPFHDGNGRSGRLFYEWIRLKKIGQEYKVGLPLYDMDLLSGRSSSEQLAAGAAIHQWVASAKSNEEFLKRSDIALDALMEIFPELTTTFPELQRQQSVAKVVINKVDVSELVQKFQNITMTLPKEYHVYHWYDASEDPDLQAQLQSTSALGLAFAKDMSQVFWASYLKESIDMFGQAFYLALDPVKTQNYGGEEWVLIDVKLKEGLRLLDLKRPEAIAELSPAVRKTLDQFQCGPVNNLSDLLRAGGERAIKAGIKCKNLIQKVLNDHIKVAGFLYGYVSSYFLNCSNKNGERDKALVLTDGSWLQSSSVRIYNSKTRDDKTERSRIESLFYQASDDGTTSPEAQKNIVFELEKEKLKQLVPTLYPGYRYMTSGGGCANGGCRYSMKIGKVGADGSWEHDSSGQLQTEDVDIPVQNRQIYPDLISSKNVPLANHQNIPNLLWDDLDGQKTDPSIKSWIQQNLLGCSSDH